MHRWRVRAIPLSPKRMKLSRLHRESSLAQQLQLFIFGGFLHFRRSAMTCEERDRTYWLCTRIQEEQDPKKFDELIWQLDALLVMIDNDVRNGCCKPN